MNQKYVFQLSRVSKIYKPDRTILENINLSFYYGAKIGVLGLNGAGKSTLLRIIAGEDKEFTGEAEFLPGVTFGYLSQEPRLDESKTVKENVMEGLGSVVSALKRFEEVSAKLGDPDLSPEAMDKLLEDQAKIQDEIDSQNGWELDHTLEVAMDALRLPPGDWEVKNLSGGERRRVALCKLLLEKPDVLLLDEPTNHLDAETVLWLEQHLQQYEGTVLAVTHDRYFLDNIAGWILELDRGRGIPWEGNYSSWLEQKEKRLEQEEKSDKKRQRTLERELEWIRMSPRARQAKSKARIKAFETLRSEEAREKIQELEIFIPPGPRLGDKVIDGNGITKAFEDKLLIDNFSFTIPPGSIVGIVGPNGAGKTTLFRMITGQEKPDSGTVEVGDTVELGYVDQLRDALGADSTVWEEISEKQEQLDLGGKLVNSRAYCARFNFTGSDQQKKVGNLSGGERNRVHLAKLLKRPTNVLLLDEPTNHLDAESVLWLEQHLQKYEGTVLAVTHDRYFLDNSAEWILELDRGRGIPWKGNYSSWLEQKEERLRKEEKQESKRQKTLQRELDWIRLSPRARQAKSKARVKAYESLVNQQTADRINDLEIYIPPGPRLGDVVIEAKGLTKSFEDKLLLENVSLSIPPGSIVGIIGGNGVGKTTLFRMIVGEEKPDSGELLVGDTVKLGYVNQSRDTLSDTKTVWEEISEGKEEIELGNRSMNSRAYCSRFNFTGSDQQKKVGNLSGGERNRVHLAKLLKSGSNVLLLDEPTNDLDVNTLRALEDAILEFAGCVLVISHDRWFLDRIATHILAFEGDSQVVMVEGNFQDYEDDKKKRLGPESIQPKRIKYRKLVH
ncbi:MAG: energy-dependent translational throttle protein EttA [Bdellovibrionales bacterium]|nr:energy-dependent translational throttle protein EttA [Bdellovibrionales bacterium]